MKEKGVWRGMERFGRCPGTKKEEEKGERGDRRDSEGERKRR